MNFIITSLVSLLICVSPLAAQSKVPEMKLFAGYNSLSMHLHPTSKLKVKAGQIAGIGIGCHFSENFKCEIEGAYRTNEVQKLVIKGAKEQFTIPINGDTSSCSIMGNGFIELPYLPSLVPYIGAGLGITAEYSKWNANIVENSLWIDMQPGNQVALSFQLIAGIKTPTVNGYYCGVEFKVLDSVLDHMCNHNRSLVFSYHKMF